MTNADTRTAATATDASLAIEIFSDVACPWCFIGKRRFDEAAERFAEAPGAPGLDVTYRSFELSPDTPIDFDGSPATYFAERKGLGREQIDQMYDTVTGVARSVGLEYDFENVQHTNTVRAHQLLHVAHDHGKQTEMAERLMRGYFLEGRHIGHIDELVDLGTDVGLEADEVRAALEADQYLEAVRADEALATRYGVTGVPFFVVDGRYGISGAQEPETLVRVLQQVWDERSDAASGDDTADSADGVDAQNPADASCDDGSCSL